MEHLFVGFAKSTRKYYLKGHCLGFANIKHYLYTFIQKSYMLKICKNTRHGKYLYIEQTSKF